jgi:hypothetical protein
MWGGLTEILELVGGAGRTWTNEEKLRARPMAGNSRKVGHHRKLSIAWRQRKPGGPLMVTVPLRYAR